MAAKGPKLDRVVYEEKPRCGRCGADIVGVIPKWRNDKPLCRECAFELEQIAEKPLATRITVEDAPPLTPEERRRRNLLFGALAVAVLILGLRVWSIAPMLKPPQPLRHGTFETDPVTDRCIENLWTLSRQLQDKRLPDPFPLCPLSGKSYSLMEGEQDTVISCPNPGQHGLALLQISRNKPVPLVLMEERR